MGLLYKRLHVAREQENQKGKATPQKFLNSSHQETESEKTVPEIHEQERQDASEQMTAPAK